MNARRRYPPLPVPPAVAEWLGEQPTYRSCMRTAEGICYLHGGQWADGCPTESVLQAVKEERARQFARYGTNDNLEDGTGADAPWLWPLAHLGASDIEAELRAQYEDHEREHGSPTWMHLIREEVAESFQESDPTQLEAELVQVAALCVSWVETIRGRS